VKFDSFQFTEYPGDLQRVDVRKGDLFVLSFPNAITCEVADAAQKMWESMFEGETVPKLLILSKGAKLGVVRREDIVDGDE